jgi:hypothetical protein
VTFASLSRKIFSLTSQGFALDIPLNSNGCSNLTLQREQNSRCNVHNRLRLLAVEQLTDEVYIFGRPA